MGLLGESQEEDRRIIAELVLQKMELYCKPAPTIRQDSPERILDISDKALCSFDQAITANFVK